MTSVFSLYGAGLEALYLSLIHILRKPIDRIGYGGYLKLALEFPDFIEYVDSVCKEFRTLYDNMKGCVPYCIKKVAVLNCWGKMRAWGCHMAVSYTHLFYLMIG